MPKPLNNSQVAAKMLDPRTSNLGTVGIALVAAAKRKENQ